ncbi:HAD family hydrolase [Luteolibacter pohnpeiensis]|uniref:HAD family hydrolase n=1 Tax=Luteolibacter pohnpeiensis TaxID=454153 RepID=A0A934S8Z5_9BACT|nr:HAD family hydrolase [Luteolibacter pohnpeiensis]MBK1884008.1 HAD family hydrolase [Luteolibacter pohnpeiensis]
MAATALSIAFDADDTLWHNQPIFERSYEKFRSLLSRFHEPTAASDTLIRNEMRNFDLYGYGIKGFTLSAIETAIQLSDGAISADEIRQLLDAAKEMLAHPVELIEGVEEVLKQLSADHRLLVVTKGDLRDQERKLEQSGLLGYFQQIEIVSEKDVASYRRICERHEIDPAQFLMVGNSLKSDILPVLELGGRGVHIPYHITWAAEQVDEPAAVPGRLFKIAEMHELPKLVQLLTTA